MEILEHSMCVLILADPLSRVTLISGEGVYNRCQPGEWVGEDKQKSLKNVHSIRVLQNK